VTTARTTSSTARRCGSPTAAHADFYTVFAKVGGETLHRLPRRARLARRQARRRRKEDGDQGHRTTAVYLDNVRVPVENVLGEVGRGHIIAFNILNIGRLKLGPGTTGGAKHVLGVSLANTPRSARRSASPSHDFGMIQHKLAEMAVRTYAAETMSLASCYRVTGSTGSKRRRGCS
jgi:alkylation response protein AidB-like acyl-CoA dehydrogenase